MSFIFNVRSTGSSMHRRDQPSAGSLPAISEDGLSVIEPRNAPPVPPRAWNRPSTKIWALGAPPVHEYETSPPPYSNFDANGVLGPKGEKLSDVRKGWGNNKHIAKRGGWKRLALIAVIIILCTVGLVVGLAIGLPRASREAKKAATGTSAGDGSGTSVEPGKPGTPGDPGVAVNPAPNTTFPAGSYRFETYLNTVASNCTNNSATWTCYPFSTYAQSRSQSKAIFDWIIYPVKDTKNYTISSTDNYFSVVFKNATLTLLKAGADDEHYFFQTRMDKPTKPNTPLNNQNVASTCYFNQTTFQAYLYTKMPKSYPSKIDANSTDTSQPFAAWPYAVKVEQVAAAGASTPSCVGPSGQSLGDFSVSDGTQLCDCLYINYGT